MSDKNNQAKRDQRVYVLVSTPEKQQWEEAAKNDDRSLNAFVRKLVNHWIKKTAQK